MKNKHRCNICPVAFPIAFPVTSPTVIKENSCVPVQFGDLSLSFSYNVACGQDSLTFYEADNLDCLPTVTARTSLSGSVNPCIAILVFELGDGSFIEKVLGRNTQPATGISGPMFTIGNVRRIFVRCNGGGVDGCRGSVQLGISYCAINRCAN